MRGFALLGLMAAGCARSAADGPQPIRWDRDTCGGCGMVISDRHFAAEVLAGPRGEAVKFDDIGCAVRWLARQRLATTPRVYVARYADGEWLDARLARYRPGRASPMGFDLEAFSGPDDGLAFEAMTTRLRPAAPPPHLGVAP